jgi:flagellar biogenesis protein FliO
MQSTGDGIEREEAKQLPSELTPQPPAWLQAIVRVFGFARRGRAVRRTELIETLNIGGKRQLMLVLCDGQRFLVGAGSDSIHSIVEVKQQRQLCEPPCAPSGLSLQMQAEVTLQRFSS